MTNKQDEKNFEAFLHKRKMLEPNDDLPQRILQAAFRMPIEKEENLLNLIREWIFRPIPAFALSLFFISGIWMGTKIIEHSNQEYMQTNLSSFLYENGGIL